MKNQLSTDKNISIESDGNGNSYLGFGSARNI